MRMHSDAIDYKTELRHCQAEWEDFPGANGTFEP